MNPTWNAHELRMPIFVLAQCASRGEVSSTSWSFAKVLSAGQPCCLSSLFPRQVSAATLILYATWEKQEWPFTIIQFLICSNIIWLMLARHTFSRTVSVLTHGSWNLRNVVYTKLTFFFEFDELMLKICATKFKV